MLTLQELHELGVTRTTRDTAWLRIAQGVYGEGKAPPTKLERAAAEVIATRGAASGRVAAALYGLDGVSVAGPEVTVPPESGHHRRGVRRRRLKPGDVRLVSGVVCISPLLTMLDLAHEVDDLVWEQALESALRGKLLTIPELEAKIAGTAGADRMRRVLLLRPPGAPATESLLETLMVQLARHVKGLPPPSRQVYVYDQNGVFVARVDLAWPELGVFIELDGQQHIGQPVYDASRETAVVAATGWLCGRFTWTEVVRYSSHSMRRLAAIIEQARRRPLPAA
jgi:hypothetical protein